MAESNQDRIEEFNREIAANKDKIMQNESNLKYHEKYLARLNEKINRLKKNASNESILIEFDRLIRETNKESEKIQSILQEYQKRYSECQQQLDEFKSLSETKNLMKMKEILEEISERLLNNDKKSNK